VYDEKTVKVAKMCAEECVKRRPGSGSGSGSGSGTRFVEFSTAQVYVVAAFYFIYILRLSHWHALICVFFFLSILIFRCGFICVFSCFFGAFSRGF
jgi:hypothetical protein